MENNISKERPSAFCFSWSESEDCEESSQGVQTEPEIFRNVLERGTQTEGTCLLPTRKFYDNAERDTYKLLEILSKDLGSFYDGKADTDCVLKVGETKFSAHRSLLSARSTVFAAMFHHDTSESRNGEVNILDVDDDVFGDVIYYIYTGNIRGLSPGTAISMYTAADKYALIELREKCMEFLMLNLNEDNVGDAALVAHAHAETQLENEVIQFIEENLEEIMLNEAWTRFSDNHSKIANKFLCLASIAIKKKMQNIHSD